jgi:hypothetical protein
MSQPLIIAPPTKYGNQFSFVKQPLRDSTSNFFNPASVFMAGVLGSASGLHLSTRHSLDADRRGRTGCADLNDKKNCFPSDVDEPYDALNYERLLLFVDAYAADNNIILPLSCVFGLNNVN